MTDTEIIKKRKKKKREAEDTPQSTRVQVNKIKRKEGNKDKLVTVTNLNKIESIFRWYIQSVDDSGKQPYYLTIVVTTIATTRTLTTV